MRNITVIILHGIACFAPACSKVMAASRAYSNGLDSMDGLIDKLVDHLVNRALKVSGYANLFEMTFAKTHPDSTYGIGHTGTVVLNSRPSLWKIKPFPFTPQSLSKLDRSRKCIPRAALDSKGFDWDTRLCYGAAEGLDELKDSEGEAKEAAHKAYMAALAKAKADLERNSGTGQSPGVDGTFLIKGGVLGGAGGGDSGKGDGRLVGSGDDGGDSDGRQKRGNVVSVGAFAMAVAAGAAAVGPKWFAQTSTATTTVCAGVSEKSKEAQREAKKSADEAIFWETPLPIKGTDSAAVSKAKESSQQGGQPKQPATDEQQLGSKKTAPQSVDSTAGGAGGGASDSIRAGGDGSGVASSGRSGWSMARVVSPVSLGAFAVTIAAATAAVGPNFIESKWFLQTSTTTTDPGLSAQASEAPAASSTEQGKVKEMKDDDQAELPPDTGINSHKYSHPSFEYLQSTSTTTPSYSEPKASSQPAAKPQGKGKGKILMKRKSKEGMDEDVWVEFTPGSDDESVAEVPTKAPSHSQPQPISQPAGQPQLTRASQPTSQPATTSYNSEWVLDLGEIQLPSR